MDAMSASGYVLALASASRQLYALYPFFIDYFFVIQQTFDDELDTERDSVLCGSSNTFFNLTCEWHAEFSLY